MNNNKNIVQIVGMALVLIGLVYVSYAFFIKKDTNDVALDGDNVVCAMDVRECPDGTSVGRTGPNCEFVCPAASQKPATSTDPTRNPTNATGTMRGPVSVTLKLNQKGAPLSESMTILSVIEDSRCPVDVQCIQAGTVRVQVKFEGGMGTSVQTIKLGETATTETESFTFVSVLPEKKSTTQILPGDYRFTFRVTKR